jgi:hypothetical protein
MLVAKVSEDLWATEGLEKAYMLMIGEKSQTLVPN